MGLARNLIVAVIAIPALIVGGSYIRNKAVGPEGWAMDNTVTRLKSNFKDPESMVIRSSYTAATTDPESKDRVIYICGLVDGKNSFGAYAGATRFVSRSLYRESLETFDTYSVNIENPRDTAEAREVDMRSSFERSDWYPHCEGKNEA